MTHQQSAHLYTGELGEAYHSQRAESRSEANQAFRATFFQDLSDPDAVILDFGCANGGILSNLTAKRRIGVEISEHSRSQAAQVLDTVHVTLAEVADHSVDTFISFHAIEHTTDPFGVLTDILRVVRPGGRVRIVLPCESLILNAQHRAWRAGDSDMHMFRWSPLTFGNLATAAGLEVQSSKLSPMSAGGKLAELLDAFPVGKRIATWAKAMRHGRIQLILDARVPLA